MSIRKWQKAAGEPGIPAMATSKVLNTNSTELSNPIRQLCAISNRQNIIASDLPILYPH